MKSLSLRAQAAYRSEEREGLKISAIHVYKLEEHQLELQVQVATSHCGTGVLNISVTSSSTPPTVLLPVSTQLSPKHCFCVCESKV